MIALLIAGLALPPQADPENLGRYAVRQGSSTLCTVAFRFAPDVGGEVEVAPGCKLAALADAARWEEDGAGGFRIADPLRHVIARVVAEEAGYSLVIGTRRLAFIKLDRPAMRSPDARAVGRWSVAGQAQACRVTLASSHRVSISPGCPVTLRRLRNPRWTADDQQLTLKGGANLRFEWADAASLRQIGGELRLIHD